jgi:hypothetical protein
VPIHGLAAVLSCQATSSATSRLLAGAGPLNTLRFPRLEYQAPVAFFRNAEADLIGRQDDRLPLLKGRKPGLLLNGYLAGRSLTPEELRDIYLARQALFPEFEHRAVTRAFVGEWMKQAPGDPGARFAMVRELAETAQFKPALLALLPLLKQEPTNPVYLRTAAELKHALDKFNRRAP